MPVYDPQARDQFRCRGGNITSSGKSAVIAVPTRRASLDTTTSTSPRHLSTSKSTSREQLLHKQDQHPAKFTRKTSLPWLNAGKMYEKLQPDSKNQQSHRKRLDSDGTGDRDQPSSNRDSNYNKPPRSTSLPESVALSVLGPGKNHELQKSPSHPVGNWNNIAPRLPLPVPEDTDEDEEEERSDGLYDLPPRLPATPDLYLELQRR